MNLPPVTPDGLTSAKPLPKAGLALAILTAMNLLNYIDRYVPSAVKEPLKTDLHLTDAETAWPLTAFVVVYMIASPIFGSLADRYPRRGVIAAGVALWSLATAAAAWATGFWTFLAARALVGVGEAAYATLSPAMLSDYYPPTQRNRVLTWFYAAIPVGAAIGFGLGGWLGQHYGWRTAFLACGLPGLLAAAAVFWVPEPPRGTFDADRAEPVAPWKQAIPLLLANRTYKYAVLGYILVTFAAGAMADWFPAFLSRHRGMDLAQAGQVVGTATVLGGLVGTLGGGWLGDRLAAAGRRNPYFLLSWASIAGAALLAVVALQVRNPTLLFWSIAGAQTLLWCYNGPINAILVNCVPSGLRARAFSLSILAIHLLGDAISPPIVGALADATSSLPTAIAVVPIALAGGAMVWWVAWRRLPAPAAAA